MEESPKRKSIAPLRALLPYVLRQRARVFGAGVALVMAAGATLAIPLAVRRVIDFGFRPDQAGFIDRYFFMLLIVVAVLALASSSRYFLVTMIGEQVVNDLRRDVFGHLTRLSANYFDTARTGEMMSRLTADTTQIKTAVGANVSVALRNLLLFCGALVLMVVTAPSLAGLVLVAIPFVVIPLVVFGKRVRVKTRQAQDKLAEASAFASEQVSAVRTMQAFTHEEAARRNFNEGVEAAFAAARDSTGSRALLTAIAIFIVFASVVCVLWVGAQGVLNGTLTAGTLGQFVLYAVFAAGALGELSQVWGELAQAAGAAERLMEILAIQPAVAAPAAPEALPATQGEVCFDAVSFSYPTALERQALDGISFTVQPGERVAIVGPSGAGKSTIFHLLLRFYDPQGGAVRMDGVDVRNADPLAVRGRIALVPQDSTIFGDSVVENIRYGAPDATPEAVIAAAKAASADEFIVKLENGYDTRIGERGVTLSGGQRQRIAIARAILRDAPVLLLDEATSALDAESELLVQQALDKLMEGRTTLVIAHRLATILKADRILVMEDGRIVEEGNHEALVAQDGLYARLARLQFGLQA